MNSPAVVIGAGVNELVAAHTLARGGHRVIVLDEREVGDDAAPDIGWIPPQIVRAFELGAHGLWIHYPDPWAVTPLPNGGRLELWRDLGRSVEAIRRVSRHDAEKWPEFCERMTRLARMLETLYTASPPDPLSHGLKDLGQLAGVGLRVRRLGRQGVEDLLRLLPMSVADLLDDWFESDPLKGILGTAGVMHLHQGPRSGGTAFALLHHHVGSATGVFRPPSSNIRRVLEKMPGVEIRRGAQVARIIVRAGHAAGVALKGGNDIAASLVVSGADPKRTLLELVDPGWLDPEFVRAVRNVRSRGVAGRVTLALDRAPGFSTLVIAPTLDYIERGYDDAKYGRVSREPYLEARSEPCAANGKHRVDVHVQYAPYTLADGKWDGNRRAALGERAVELLSQHVPGLSAAVCGRVALSPRDFEDIERFPEGQAYHAELALDQVLWMRPVPGCARYRSPITGLYLCGPGTHPGGGIAGAAGANAAREILRSL